MSSDTSEHSSTRYVKIWIILTVLLLVSILGPMIGVKAITLVTAFGIAIVKATMVAAYFMHLNIEKRYIWYLLFMMLLFLGVLFAGLAPDIMESEGKNWSNPTPEAILEPAADDNAHPKADAPPESE